MHKDDIEKVIQDWKNFLLTDHLSEYDLEIDNKITEKFAALALYLDFRTMKAAGKSEEYYEGYRQAAVDLLNLLGIEIGQDDELKVITLFKKESDRNKQEELKKNIWG